MKNIKQKIIIDTDPGVDDATALLIAMHNENLDIKLITTTAGNVGIEKTTRNALFLVEKFNKNIPVCKGAEKPMKRSVKDASNIHGVEGLGNYVPQTVKKTALEENAVDKMYEIIKQNPNEIILVELGPHTNLGYLFTKYPECEFLIKKIIFEGGSAYGKENVKPHISFNISCDPEAAEIMFKTSLNKAMIPSEIGRYIAYFTPEQIDVIKNVNNAGKFLSELYSGYVNKFGLNTTQTNDLCAIMYLLYPEIFTTHKCDLYVDTKITPGKTLITDNTTGLVDFVENVDRETFFNLFLKNLKNIK